MDEIKTIVSIPWMTSDGYEVNRQKITGEADSYAVPLIYRATRLRCNSLTRIPVYVYNEQDDEVEYYFEKQLPLRELLWLSEASSLLRGAVWLLKLKNRFRYGKGLQWLNPFTIQFQLSGNELLFWQQLPTGERFPKSGFWTADDFIYIREFNPLDDLGPGVSAAQVALNDSQTSYATSKFLSNFFSSDALPVTMVSLPSGTQSSERERVENWFKKKLKGLRGRSERVIGVSGEVKLEKLTAELKTFDFPSIDNHALEQVAHAFDIPKTMLSTSSANYATAQVERRIYTEDTIVPRCKIYEQYLNAFLADVGQRIEFCPEELPEMQEDETVRAGSLKTLVDAGIPLLAAIDMLGYDLSEDAETIIQEAEKKKEEAANKPPMLPVNGNGQKPMNGVPLTQASSEVPSDTGDEDAPELKYNENHDPENGQFSEGGGGGTLGDFSGGEPSMIGNHWYPKSGGEVLSGTVSRVEWGKPGEAGVVHLSGGKSFTLDGHLEIAFPPKLNRESATPMLKASDKISVKYLGKRLVGNTMQTMKGYEVRLNGKHYDFSERYRQVEAAYNKKAGKSIELKTDLDKWLRKSLKRVQAGKSAVVEFESEYLTPELKQAVVEAVEKAQNEEEVRVAFSAIVEGIQHGNI